MRSIQYCTNILEFDEVAPEHLKNMYQIHVYSVANIYSYYYYLDETSEDEVRKIAMSKYEKIKERSNNQLKVTLFEHDGVFLITEHEHILSHWDLYEFDAQSFSYEYMDNNCSDVFNFVGKKPIDEYIVKAVKSVGADRILPHIEQPLKTILEKQNEQILYYEKHREKSRKSPKILVEIYKIEKDYKPKKVTEFKVSSMEAFHVLPEIRDWLVQDRMASKAIDIETGKVVESDIEDIIESIKFAKWQRKHPPLIDLNDAMRMELDNDDPNFLSWDDFVANDDEYEEGDDEYEPGF